MKTKSGKSHFSCRCEIIRKSGISVNENFRFVAFDGVDHMEKIKKSYAAHGIECNYSNLINLDA